MRQSIFLASCGSAALAVMAGPSVAQTEPAAVQAADASNGAGLEEIIVVAQKRAENLQKVPIAITAVAQERLESAGVTDMQDLQVAVPGLQVLNIGGSVTPRIRGVGAGFTSAGVESPVATYVDDVYYAYGADVNVDLSDSSQVTILKGPQGTLFGRNATGGVLQVATRDPSQDFQGNFGVSFDNYLTARANMYVTGGLSDDVSAGLSVSYAHQGKGYGKNFATGNDVYKLDHSFGLRGKIKAEIGDQTTIRVSGDYAERRGPQSAVFRPFPGYNIANPAPTYPSRKWDANNWLDPKNHYSGGGGSLIVEHDFGFAEFKSISAYRDAKSGYLFLNQPSTVVTQSFQVEESSDQFTQEIQLVSPSGGALTWAIGAFYIHNNAEAQTTVNNFGALAAAFSNIYVPGEQKTDSVAGFAQATYAITPSTRLTGGIRYTYEKKKFNGQTIVVSAITGASTTIFNSGPLDFTFKKPTWRISLDQDLAPGILGYLSYNRGVKSGGFSIRAPTNPAFDPEQLDAYEAGIKSELFGRSVRFNLAGFYYDYKNIQLPAYVPAGTGTAILNGAAAESYGIDADIEARLSENLRLNASANWLHARYTDFPRAPIGTPVPGPGGSFTATTALGDASGNALAYSPNFTYSLGADFTIPTSAGKVVLNVTDNYNSGFYSEADSRLKQKSFHNLNASVKWSSEDDRYTARLFVNNILNEAVASQFLTFANGFIADYSSPPRVIGGSFQVAF
jgi:iron complex outermembrane recepter protein